MLAGNIDLLTKVLPAFHTELLSTVRYACRAVHIELLNKVSYAYSSHRTTN